MTTAQGTAKQTRFDRQSAKGTLADVGGGNILRRVSSTFELVKESYTTENEITSTRQLKSNRHGVKTVNGAVQGILSPGTYADILSSVLRKDFAAVSDITGLSITVAGTGPYTVTRGSGSFLTDGIKVGMVVRLTAGTFDAANLNKNLFVTGVTATVLTVLTLNGSDLTAEGPVASATLSVPGKVSYIPDSGHTNIYYTVEEWYSDISISERNQDVKFTEANISLPGSGNSEISLTAIGLDQSNDTTAYYTSPAAETSTDALAAANGLLLVNGVQQAVITDLSININGNGNGADGVVGTNLRPDVFMGKVMVQGSFTAYFESRAIANLFSNETEFAILAALSASDLAAADFMTFAMTEVKVNTDTPDDGETGLKRTYNYVAVYDSAGGSGVSKYATTLMVQDSQAA